EQPDGVRPFRGRDPGGDPLASVHWDRVRGAAAILVRVVHRRQLEPVRLRLGQRCTDEAGRVPHHEGDELRGRHLGGEDEVALVLPVLVIDDDDRTSGRDLLDRLFDRGERVLPAALAPGHALTAPISFSTYFAITSTSTFTRAPGSLRPRVE